MFLVSILMRLFMLVNLKIKMVILFSFSKKILSRGLGFGKGWFVYNY